MTRMIMKTLALVTLTIILTGCGGSTGGQLLSLLPEGFHFTDTNGNPIAQANEGDTVQVRATPGRFLLLQFRMGSSAVDFADAILGRDDNGTLVALDPSIATVAAVRTEKTSGLPDQVTVFMPCVAAITGVRICPNETSLFDEGSGCTDEIDLSAAVPSSDGYTWTNPTRAGDEDCRVEGPTTLFNTFFGQGF